MYFGNRRQHTSQGPLALSSHLIWPWTKPLEGKKISKYQTVEEVLNKEGTTEQTRHYHRNKPGLLTPTLRVRDVSCVSSFSLSDLVFLWSLAQTPEPIQPIEG